MSGEDRKGNGYLGTQFRLLSAYHKYVDDKLWIIKQFDY